MIKNSVIKRILHYLPAILLMLAVPMFAPVFLIAQNTNEVYFSDLIMPIISFTLVSLIAFGLAFAVLKSVYKAAIASAFFSVLFCNFTLIFHAVKIIAPFIKHPHFIVIIIFAYILLIVILNKIHSREVFGGIVKIACIAVCTILLFNLGSAIINKSSISKHSYTDYYVPTQEKQPNIYYIIPDEYTSFDLLKQYAKYDNDAFKDFLQERKFTVSQTSENNYSNTATVITGILCLDYMPPADDSLPKYAEMRADAPELYKILSSNGYTLRGLGEWSFLCLPPALGPEVRREASTITGTTFTQMLWDKTPIFGMRPYENDRELITKSLDFFKDDKNYTSDNTFTMMHLNCPHMPIIFNADGSATDRITQTAYRYFSSQKSYLNQLEYITKELEKTIDEILKRDPDSIIIVQSDHSARSFYNLGIPEKDWTKILNAVYYRGEPIEEIEGKSGLNTMIAVLNRLFDTQLHYREMLPEHTLKPGSK